MRNKVELSDGTILEIGKKYKYLEDIEEVIYIDEYGWLTRDQHCESYFWNLKFHDNSDWFPYEEPKTEKWYEYLRLDFENEAETTYRLEYSNRPKLANVIYLREWNSKEEMIEDLKK
jgi:hypothetical protein